MTTFLDRPELASATLLVLSGPARGSHLQVPAGGLLLGRIADPAGRLGDDRTLSRRHARLDATDGTLSIEDLGSTNGTFLNGQRISGRQPVWPGDVVTLGTSQLQALPAPTTAPAQPGTPAATAVLPPVAPHPAPALPQPDAAPQPPVPRPAPAPAAHPVPRPAPPVTGPVPRPGPARLPGLVQPGPPPASGSPGLVELSEVQPSFVAIVGRYLGRVVGVYLALAVLLGAIAALLQIVHYNFGVALPAAAIPEYWAKPVAGLLVLSAVVLAAVGYLRSAATRLSLYAGRLDIDRGLLRREHTTVDLRRLRRVSLDQTVLQRLTGDGTLVFELVDRADPVAVTGLARGQQLRQIYGQLAAQGAASHR